MNKRLEMLEKMTNSGQADSFAWYGLAMEYRKLGRMEESLSAFDKLRSLDADYLPMYLMAAQLLIEANRNDEARDWIARGLALAERKGDDKARSELRDALAAAEG